MDLSPRQDTVCEVAICHQFSRSVPVFKCSRGQIYSNETLLTGAGCECARSKYVLNNFRQVELLPAAADRGLCWECVCEILVSAHF